MTIRDLGFRAFDCDNHYYEAEDAFTRHIDRRMAKRAMQWAVVDGRKRLLVGGRINRFIPNPTFDPVARPGALDEFFRGRNPEGKSMPELFGRLEPIRAAYRDRDARLALMDEQGIEAAFLFPTLGVGMEEALKHDPPALVAAFGAFNRWLEEDWGFAYRERLFAAPMITLVDVDAAVAELERALERDVRVVCLRSAPVATRSGNRSPGDAMFDPFWARASEAGVTVAFHSGDSGYHRYAEDWGESSEMEAFRYSPLRLALSANPILDTMAALVCHGVFARHPRLRVATIESGSEWVALLLAKLKKAHGQMPQAFVEDPRETFCRHVWVSPYYEDDIAELRDAIGAGHILMGSDFPHAEGLAEPTAFVDELSGFSSGDIRSIMRDNGWSLARRVA
ncbi:MAG TPA: amidohydrolase family protein [Candidatus Limnocylindrales bacterium]|nr:amidohydrolase family protein [Candidatus Limnocylindrales bacterium]